MDLKQPVSTPVIVTAAVIALIGVGFFGFRKMNGSQAAFVTNAKDTRKNIEQLALQSGGDYDKLSPDERKLLDATYHGNGRRAIQNVYKSISTSGGH